MGGWAPKPRINGGIITPLSDQDSDEEYVESIEDLQMPSGDFVLEKHAKFKDFYQLGPLLDGGLSGEVRKWIHKTTKAVRAVKIIRKDNLKGKERIKFTKELSILKSLEHPNIMRLYKVFKDQKRYYIVLDLCSGGELFDEISK